MKRVTGLGGVFFKARDKGGLLDWYRAHLGIDSEEWGGFAFLWREHEAPDKTGYTVWSAFDGDTDHFAPSDKPYMLNFRVADLSVLLEALRDEGVEIVGELQEHPNGKFAWVLDPEGNKVELWEPVDPDADPYLP